MNKLINKILLIPFFKVKFITIKKNYMNKLF